MKNESSECPRRWDIEQYLAGEQDGRAEISSHLERCPACRARAEGLERERQEFLERHPPGPAIERAFAGKRPAPRPVLRWAALAACLVVASAAFFLWREQPSERAKGSFSIQVYLLREGKISRAASGQEFFPGDRIQFTYTSPRPGWLFFASLDERGRVFSFNPGGADHSFPVEAGSERTIGESVQLDENLGWERIFAVFSDRPLRFEEISAAASRLAQGRVDLESLERLSLDWPQTSFLMLKRPR